MKLMKLLTGICFLTVAASSLALGQSSAVPANWIGTWILNLQESKIGPIVGSGVPAGGVTVTSQTLQIAATAGHLKVTGDTVTTELGTTHEEFDVDLEHPDSTLPEGPKISFTRSGDTAFAIVLTVNNKTLGNQVGVNRFLFSGDGRKLIETKTHTEREPTPEGMDPAESRVIRTSTSILMFDRDTKQVR
jgi:hypothetical protein